MPSGYDPMGGHRFSLATNAERACAEIMLICLTTRTGSATVQPSE